MLPIQGGEDGRQKQRLWFFKAVTVSKTKTKQYAVSRSVVYLSSVNSTWFSCHINTHQPCGNISATFRLSVASMINVDEKAPKPDSERNCKAPKVCENCPRDSRENSESLMEI